MTTAGRGSTEMELEDFKESMGICGEDDWMGALQEWVVSGVVPALCIEGCDVEPDGTCPHGNPSILMAVGLV